MTKVAARIEARLKQALSPTRLLVVDDSHLHAGHVGARPSGETHFTVEIVSPAFEGLSRVARQRLVYDALAADMAGGVHALSLVTKSPKEAATG
jgi:BolA protein